MLSASAMLRSAWSFNGLPFTLSTDDPDLHAFARRLFAHWPPGPSNGKGGGVNWVVTRRGAPPDPECWDIQANPVVPGVPTWAHTISGAIGHVEIACADHIFSTSHQAPTLHAAVLTSGRDAFAVTGRTKTGKTILATGLGLRGYRLLSDDVAFMELIRDEVLAQPFPKRVHVRGSSRELLGEAHWNRLLAHPLSHPCEDCRGLMFQPREVHPAEYPAAANLSAVFVLGRDGSTAAPAEVRRLDAGTAAMELFKYLRLGDRGDHRTLIRFASGMADRLPVYDVGRGDLPAMLDAVERVLTEP